MFLQVSIWAAVFVATGEVEDASRAIYFSLVNFTTLGYGDITLSEERAILGAMEASSGILMLGLSTAFLFYVLSFSARERVSSIGDDTHVS
jgi:voltage-gated potassium channel Kch